MHQNPEASRGLGLLICPWPSSSNNLELPTKKVRNLLTVVLIFSQCSSATRRVDNVVGGVVLPGGREGRGRGVS